jgi:ParB-like chromosome segregation protein Spo0J
MENKYQVMPPLSDEEYQALKGDIAENGVQVRVVLDADGTIIDGYHRVRAWKELNIEGHDLDPYPEQIRSELTTDAEKRDLAWRLNMLRRHLNQAQKRDAIVAKLKETPHWADNRLALLLGVDHKTVRSVRTSLEARNELPKHELLEGADGKYYPRERPGDTKQTKDHIPLVEQDDEGEETEIRAFPLVNVEVENGEAHKERRYVPLNVVREEENLVEQVMTEAEQEFIRAANKLRFYEAHVRAERPGLARVMDVVEEELEGGDEED